MVSLMTALWFSELRAEGRVSVNPPASPVLHAINYLPGRLDELPADGTVYVVCRSAVRSARVAAYLNAGGWDAVNVAGGMRAWLADGRELVADHGEPLVI